MFIEIGGFCIPFTIWFFCYIFRVEQLYTLFFAAFSSSVVAFLFWAYSKRLAQIYQRERSERIKIRQDFALKKNILSNSGTCSNLSSLLSVESVDVRKIKECEGKKNSCFSVSYDSNIRLINEEYPTPFRSVLRISPVFSSFCAIVLGTLSLILYIRMFINASLAFESS